MGFVYELGTPPVRTRFSQTATLFLTRGFLERALELALQGVDAEPENPIHYLLAGRAHARLAQYGEADAMFTEAQRIYPAYELDIEPERESAWIELFNEGIAAYSDGERRAYDRGVGAGGNHVGPPSRRIPESCDSVRR